MGSAEKVDQLAFVVASGHQVEDLMQQLIKNGFYFTRIDTSGGIFQEATVCLLIGFNHVRMPALFSLVDQFCRPYQEFIPTQISLSSGVPPMHMIEAVSGGALIYVLDVEQFEQL